MLFLHCFRVSYASQIATCRTQLLFLTWIMHFPRVAAPCFIASAEDSITISSINRARRCSILHIEPLFLSLSFYKKTSSIQSSDLFLRVAIC